jgi:diguanylate cyclase (GGDEF)-like protein
MADTEPVHLAPRARIPTPTEGLEAVTSRPGSAPHARDHSLLMTLAGEQPGLVVELRGPEVVIGRGDRVGLRVTDPGVSWRHARVFKSGGHYYIEDLRSTNGTFVGAERVVEPRRLEDGDHIGLGRRTVLRYGRYDDLEADAAMRMYESTVRDALTGAHNRSYFDERLRSEFSFAQRHESSLSLLMLDIDHFKLVNDAHGHAVGDAVLRVLVRLLERIVRPEDVLARYGGEEFVVLAREISTDNANILADRICAQVAALELPWQDSTIRITVSVGVATQSTDSVYDSPQGLVAAADSAMYEAKARGRNQVVTA